LYDPVKSSWKETVGSNNFTQAERALQININQAGRDYRVKPTASQKLDFWEGILDSIKGAF
jgi:hypothetical protein